MHIARDPGAGLKALLIAVLLAPAARGAAIDLDDAVAVALARDPQHAVFAAEADAARERAVAAGQLPDPELRIGVRNLPAAAPDLDRDGMTMVELGWMQRFPPRHSRGLARATLEHHAAHFGAAGANREREVRLAVERLWRELDYVDAALALLAGEEQWLRDQLAVVTAAYAAGAGGQAGLLQARQALLEIEEQRIGHRATREAALAELEVWLGMPPAERVAAPPPLPPAPASGLAAHPLLLAAEHEAGASDAAVALARSQYRPAFGLEVGYGLRQRSERLGEPRPDLLSAMLTVELPLFPRQRQDRAVAAARAAARAATARSAVTRRELALRLAAAQAELDRLRAAQALVTGEAERLAGAGVAAALAAWQSATGDFAGVVATRRRQFELRQLGLRLATDQALVGAELRYLAGEPT